MWVVSYVSLNQYLYVTSSAEYGCKRKAELQELRWNCLEHCNFAVCFESCFLGGRGGAFDSSIVCGLTLRVSLSFYSYNRKRFNMFITSGDYQ